MFKRIVLAPLLLVTTALTAHVWADQGCPICGQAWQDATDAQTGAGQDKGYADAMRETAVDFRDAVAYCHDNHGGATSEVDYQSGMTDAETSFNRGDLNVGMGTVQFGHGDTSMAAGNIECPNSCSAATGMYAAAEQYFSDASGFYSTAYDDFLEAVLGYDWTIQFLVGEIDGYPCGCTFTW